jgi:hypothetical protein
MIVVFNRGFLYIDSKVVCAEEKSICYRSCKSWTLYIIQSLIAVVAR